MRSTSLVVGVICLLGVAGAAHAQKEKAGRTFGRLDEFTGMFTQRIAVEVPPFHGLEPALALEYGSAGGNGFVGVGWDLKGFSVIQEPWGNDPDHFQLDGEPLIQCTTSSLSPSCTAIKAAFGSVTKGYSLFHDDRRRIRKVGGVDDLMWEVIEPDGTLSRYDDVWWGGSSAFGHRWLLSYRTDRHGNRVDYDWDCPTQTTPGGPILADCQPAQVSYNTVTVTFESEPRTDTILFADGITDSSTGVYMGLTKKRLKRIVVRVSGSIVRSYDLSYRDVETNPAPNGSGGSATRRSLLREVVQRGTGLPSAPDPNDLPPWTFTYSGMTPTSFGAAEATGPREWSYCGNGSTGDGGAPAYPLIPGDFNGDRCTDFFQGSPANLSRPAITLSRCDGTASFRPYVTADIDNGRFSMADPGLWRFGDFNGDGKTDFAQLWRSGLPTSDEVVHVFRSRASAADGSFVGFYDDPMFAVRMDQQYPDYGGNDSARVQTGDFNGDGLTDFAIIPHCASDYEYCTLPIKLQIARRVDVDIDSDGSWNWRVLFDEHDGPVGTFQNTQAHWELYQIRRYKYADFDGDGRTDVLRIEGQNTDPAHALRATIFYSRLKGTGTNVTGTFEEFESAGPLLPYRDGPYSDHSLHDDERVLFGDFNGDGMSDIAYVNGGVGLAAQPMSIYLSYGAHGAFSAAIPGPLQRLYNTEQFYSTSWIPIGDFNGDGRDDIGYNAQRDQPLTLYLSLGYEASTLSFNSSVPGPSTWSFDCGRYADVTGDGRLDLIDLQYGSHIARIHRTLGDSPDLLTRVDNGLGGAAIVTYSPSTRFKNDPTSPVMQVVRTLTIADGNGGSSTSDFRYKGGLYDAYYDRFLGFSELVESLPLTESDQGVRPHRRTTFIQDVKVPPSLEDKVELFKGDPDAAAPLLQRVDYTYRTGNPSSPCLFEAPYTTLTTKIEQRDFDETGLGCPENWVLGSACDHGRRTLVEREYDLMGTGTCPGIPSAPAWKAGYGNRTKETLHGDPDTVDGAERVVESVFPTTANFTNYVVDRPVAQRVRQGTAAGGAIVQQENYFYDNPLPAGADGSSGWDVAVSKGDRTATARWIDRPTPRYVAARAEYDTYGNQTATVDELGDRNTTAFETTRNVYPRSRTNAVGHITALNYDLLCGVLANETDPNGLLTTYTNDKLCRRTRADLPGGGFESASYSLSADPAQRYTRHAGPGANAGELYSFEYLDALGRTVKTKARGPSAAQDILTTTTYDERGRVKSAVAQYYASEPAPVPTLMRYDAFDRETRVTLPDLKTRTFEHGFELRRYRVLATDEEGRQKKTFYDGFGNISELREKKDATAWIASKHTNELARTEIEDPAGYKWTKLLDSVGRVYEERHPDKGTWSFDYWDNDWLYQASDNATPRNVTQYWYDEIGRRMYKGTRVGQAGERWVESYYDEYEAGFANIGRRTYLADESGIETYRWDIAGNLARRVRTMGSINYTFQFGYDTGKRLRWRTYPDGDTFGTSQAPLQYDDAGRLTSAPGIVSGVAYTSWDAVKSFLNGNGIVTTRAYDPARRWLTGVASTLDHPLTCSTITIRRGQCVIDWCGDQFFCGPGTFQCCQTPPPDVVQDITYARDGLGRVRQATSPFAYEGWSHTFDLLGRLTQSTSATNAYYNQSWTYDDIGNITSNSAVGAYTYQAPKPGGGGYLPHAVSGAGGFGYAYDANGNMTGGRLGTISWNGDGLPAKVGSWNFLYDGDGRRTKKYQSGNIPSSVYYPDNDYEVNQSVATKYFRLGDLLVAKRQGTSSFWLHTDDLGSVQAVTDAAGNVVWRQQYHPYGEAFAASSSHVERHGFTGERADESGLLYLSARYHDPILGRFISADDQIGADGIVGLNTYSYASNDPVNNTDHSGHFVETAFDIVMATISVKQAFEHPTFASIAGAVLDVGAVIIPAVPAVGGRLINAAQVGNKIVDTAKGAKSILPNAAKGAAFEAKVVKNAAKTQDGVVTQLTVKTESGVKTRLDVAGKDSRTGAVKLTEAKASATAPLTKNQKAAFPEIAESGATVVGKGKPGFPGGTKIPPTKVEVVRP